jgi:hypothetical protein
MNASHKERRGTGPFRQFIGAFPFPPFPPSRRGTGPFPQIIGAFPFPPHPPSHNEPAARGNGPL